MKENSLFKREYRRIKIWNEFTHRYEFQCPVCKRWFCSSDSYGTYNSSGVKLHIAKMARIEVFNKALGKKITIKHFTFYKKNTVENKLGKRQFIK